MPNDESEDDIITLELPASVVAQLKEIREQLGDEFVDMLMADLLEATLQHVKGKLALRGAFPNKGSK